MINGRERKRNSMMRRTIWIGWAAATVVMTTNAPAQDCRTDINPALWYYQAMLLGPREGDTNRDYLLQGEWRGEKLPAKVGEALGCFQAPFRYLRNASHATVACDWGIDLTPGPETLLPHLARCKQLATLEALEATWELQHGNEAAARDDLIGAFALARDSSRDSTVIAALVQFAAQNNVIETVARNFGSLDAATLEQLASGFDAAPPAGTLANAYETGERYCNYEWLGRKIVQWQKESGGDDGKVMAQAKRLFDEFGGEGGTNQFQAVWKKTRNSDELLALVRGMEPFYNEAVRIIVLPHGPFEEQAKQFEASLDRADNPLLKAVFPLITKARQKEFRAQALLAMFHAAAAFKAHGEAGFNSVNDPFGQGPFQMNRFIYETRDRGFQLTSAYNGAGYPETLIFVESGELPADVLGPKAGRPLESSTTAK